MHRRRLFALFGAAILIAGLLPAFVGVAAVAASSPPDTVILDNTPATLPPNLPSLGYEATSTSEWGTEVSFGGTARLLTHVTLTMSDWAIHSDYPSLPAGGFAHPITLNLYAVGGTVADPAPGALIKSVTQTFTIPWRPETPVCPTDSTAYVGSDSDCYHGYAFNITFDLTGQDVVAPNQVIVGIAYDTSDYGASPLRSTAPGGGPYDSLNVATFPGTGDGTTETQPSVGTLPYPLGTFLDSTWSSAYGDGGTGGTGSFRFDPSSWGSYQPSIRFEADTPCTTTCYADAVNGNDANGGATAVDAKKTIQAAIDAVQSNGTVRVLPGDYHESAPNSAPTSIAGTYQFGLFFGSAKPGITVEGVTSADVPIADASLTQATITTDATNDFGTDGTFVEAKDITIRGVKIGPNDSGDNKTIEVVGDDFTLQYAATAIPGGGGSIYIDDFSLAGDVVKSYHILDDLFADGTSVDISSGAGNTGPVSGRTILRNTFDMGDNGFNAVSFNGTGGPEWFTLPVGGAIIKDNSFSNSTQYVRARGAYDNSQFDWASYWNDNTFDKAAVDLVTESPFDVRSYTYTSSPYTFTNVRRIGGTIQGEIQDGAISHAVAGDTILVKAGVYPEQVTVDRSLTLKGAQAGVSTSGRSFAAATESLVTSTTQSAFTVTAPNSTIDGFSVTDSVSTGAAIGVYLRAGADGATVTNNIVRTIKTTDTSSAGAAQGVYLEGGPDNVSVVSNSISDVHSKASAKGIFIGNSGAASPSTNTLIKGNDIVSVASDSKGGYGILLNNGGGATANTGLHITANTINTVSGGWAHAIGIEANAPGVNIDHNVVANLSATSADKIAVWFENEDTSFSSATVNRNSLDVGAAAYGIAVQAVSGTPLDGTCNWFGAASGPSGSGSGTGSPVTPLITFSPWLISSALSGPCVGSSAAPVVISVTATPSIGTTGTTVTVKSSATDPIGLTDVYYNLFTSGGTFVCNLAHSTVPGSPTSYSDVTVVALPMPFAGLDTGAGAPCPAIGIAEGSYTLTANWIDGAGNSVGGTYPANTVLSNYPASAQFTPVIYDTTAPVIAPHAPVTVEATGPSGAVVTYTSPATSDAVDGPGVATCLPASGSTFALGNTTVNCDAVDTAGNHAVQTHFTVTVQDTHAPVAAPTQAPPANGSGWNKTDVVVTWHWSDTGAGIDSGNCTTTTTSSGEGTLTLGATCKDLAGNTGSATYTVKVDKTAPAVSIVTHPATSTASTAAAFTFTTTDGGSGIASVVCKLDAGAPAPCSGSTAYTVGAGSHTFTVTATDVSGNSAAASFTWVVTSSGPTITVGHTANGSNGWNKSSPVALVITVTPGTAPVTAKPVCTNNGNPLTVTGTSSPYSASVTGEGTHAISCKVTDTAAKSATGTDTVKIDTVAPGVTAPASFTVDATTTTGAVVSYASSFSDSTSGLATSGCVPASGSAFAFGVTTVTCSATDKAGNSQSKSFTLTVRTLKQTKQAVLASLQAQLASTTNKDTKYRLTDAIKHVQNSLEASLWVTTGAHADGSHLDPTKGGKVFDEEKIAVNDLMCVSHPSSAIGSAIAALDNVDKLLAQTAINDAIAIHADPTKIGAAQKEMTNAQSDLGHGHYDTAIDHWKAAWSKVAALH